jgi:hypothetical protein
MGGDWAFLISRDTSIAEGVLCIAVLAIMVGRGLSRRFPFLAALLLARFFGVAAMVAILFFRRQIGLDVSTAYSFYFYSAWIFDIAQTLLLIACIYQVYKDAMRPLQGLQQIGKVIFRWVAAVSVAVSIAIAIAPHLSATSLTNNSTTVEIANIAGQAQQGTNVLALCLLLFVCFAIRPLGMTYHSRIFGVTLGLGFIASTSLVQAAWLSVSSAQSLYSPIYLIGIGGSIVALCVWGLFFVLPEEERQMVLLPTTSPFFTWNRISEALGDEPGFVAVAGFKPDMLAAAELKVLSSTLPKAAAASLPLPQQPSASREAVATPALQSMQTVAASR